MSESSGSESRTDSPFRLEPLFPVAERAVSALPPVPPLEVLCSGVLAGLVTVAEFWEGFTGCRVVMPAPPYRGMALLRSSDGRWMGIAASSPERLGGFVRRDVSWVELTGAELLALPVLPRVLVLEPGQQHELAVDLGADGAAASFLTGDVTRPRLVGIESATDGGLRGVVVPPLGAGPIADPAPGMAPGMAPDSAPDPTSGGPE